MADVNWKSIGGISLIGGIIGYISVWNKQRRYRKHLVNKFGADDGNIGQHFNDHDTWLKQFGDPEWKTKVVANNDGKPSPYDGKLSWDISYYTPLGITFDGDISKNPKQKHEGYTVLINCDNLGGCGGNKRMGISPKLLNLTKFKTMPQVKKAFKKFIDDLFTGKMKCQEGGETLTDETITHCVGCDIYDYGDTTRNGYVCHHHLYTSDRIPPSIVFDDGRIEKTYNCKKHTKEAIWMEEYPNDNEYEVGGLTISDSDLIPQVKYLNPRERMIRQRFGLGAETFEARGYEPNKPFYSTTREYPNLTTVMHPLHCSHHKKIANYGGTTAIWTDVTFYDTIEEMVEDNLELMIDTQWDGITEESEAEYNNLKTIGEARKFLKEWDFKLDFAPCFRKERDYDSKALNALPIKVRKFEAESKKTNEMDKFFEWILEETPYSGQSGKPYSRKIDYLAQRYSDEELKVGLINAYEAGDIHNAKLFAAAIGRQGFISKYQAEGKV